MVAVESWWRDPGLPANVEACRQMLAKGIHPGNGDETRLPVWGRLQLTVDHPRDARVPGCDDTGLLPGSNGAAKYRVAGREVLRSLVETDLAVAPGRCPSPRTA
mgnify:CR=1 FL=1